MFFFESGLRYIQNLHFILYKKVSANTYILFVYGNTMPAEMTSSVLLCNDTILINTLVTKTYMQCMHY